ncbi:hypothetical protein GQ53DRAFT_747323 [Thozetella sp. PMI_491]|nr:hypothetical protein GQ53DRAFT_747323 [Thozetella sp. PMI_491]
MHLRILPQIAVALSADIAPPYTLTDPVRASTCRIVLAGTLGEHSQRARCIAGGLRRGALVVGWLIFRKNAQPRSTLTGSRAATS